ncbi:defective in Cullin neddylation protein 1 [Meredithblackwellia eburnea MCA 4105]
MSGIHKSTKEQRTREFMDITGCIAAEAGRFLKSTSWRLDTALDAFYNDPSACRAAELNRDGAKGGAATTKNLEKLWEKYQDPKNEAETDLDGTMLYCQDLHIDPTEVIFLALAWLTKAPSMPRFSKKGFVDGWKSVGKDTLELQRAYIPRLKSDLNNADTFRKIYNFAFDYAKEAGQKSMQLEIAAELWNLLIPLDPENRLPAEHLAWWQDFLVQKGGRAVSKDTWTLFHEFSRTIDPDFREYDEEGLSHTNFCL